VDDHEVAHVKMTAIGCDFSHASPDHARLRNRGLGALTEYADGDVSHAHMLERSTQVIETQDRDDGAAATLQASKR